MDACKSKSLVENMHVDDLLFRTTCRGMDVCKFLVGLLIVRLSLSSRAPVTTVARFPPDYPPLE